MRPQLLPCLERSPTAPVDSAIIWLHGLGADGHDFAPLVPQLALPTTRYVFPHAPHQAVTINAGYVMPSWYDIRWLASEGGDHFDADREDPAGVRTAAGWVEALVAREIERGVPASRIVLAGFSQGGALALHTGLRHAAPLAAILVLSGYLVLESTLDAEASEAGRAATVWFGHGTRDDVVPIAGGREAHRRTKLLGAETSWHEWSMGHEVCIEEIRAIKAFLHGRLSR
jgi:phospholipase/carboxylesterase